MFSKLYDRILATRGVDWSSEFIGSLMWVGLKLPKLTHGGKSQADGGRGAVGVAKRHTSAIWRTP